MNLSEYAKAAVALIGLVGYVLLTFITFDPSLVTAVQLLVPAAVGVVLVWGAKNHTPDDLNKALMALASAAITVVSYFTTVPADTANKIGMAIGALCVVVGVYWARNTVATGANPNRI
jgi:glucose uptake protein GlcU